MKNRSTKTGVAGVGCFVAILVVLLAIGWVFFLGWILHLIVPSLSYWACVGIMFLASAVLSGGYTTVA